MSGQSLVFGASLLWILLCMRFWWVIDREHPWQRRCIAIGAGLGGGLIYIIGTMLLQVWQAVPAEEPGGSEIRVMQGAKPAAHGGDAPQ